MKRLVFLVLLLSLLFHESSAAEACNRRCGAGGMVVPYPFGFSGSCPIILSCVDADGNSTAALVRGVGGG
uniref:Wall-associated receptor kinase galacturonan-binding domain-containing protein n=1 Tax=Leersia perrieri TaxID=77586 RepID=A0A0D9Y199_9ORYZ